MSACESKTVVFAGSTVRSERTDPAWDSKSIHRVLGTAPPTTPELADHSPYVEQFGETAPRRLCSTYGPSRPPPCTATSSTSSTASSRAMLGHNFVQELLSLARARRGSKRRWASLASRGVSSDAECMRAGGHCAAAKGAHGADLHVRRKLRYFMRLSSVNCLIEWRIARARGRHRRGQLQFVVRRRGRRGKDGRRETAAVRSFGLRRRRLLRATTLSARMRILFALH